ncbi:MAG: glutamine-hydrolyzing GMP synthase, partial [Candidatus Cloacimonadota bacterium]|nr:glutamine-hydrolyzing GMP synthase [Candidatus Cloacimonadota bacterium]
MKHELVLILDFGSQYTQLIAKNIRKMKIYCEIVPFNISYEEVHNKNPKALILSGSPSSVSRKDAPFPDDRILELDIPILGICYGMQLITHLNGGEIIRSKKKEYGRATIQIEEHDSIFANLAKQEFVWMSHGDALKSLPKNFVRIAFTDNSPFAAIKHTSKPIYALQFHPEVVNTENGITILKNFVVNISKFSQDWTPESFI